MNVTSVSDACVEAIASFEGFSATPYWDGGSPGSGTLTIGYGTTAADVSPLPGYLSESQARILLRHKLNTKYLPVVNRALQHFRPTRNMVEASVCFAYNLGEYSFAGAQGFGSLTRALAGNVASAVGNAFLAYYNPGSVWAAGLLRRRQFEDAWFSRPDAQPIDPWAGYPADEVKYMHEYDALHAKGLSRTFKDVARESQLAVWFHARHQQIWRLASATSPSKDGKGWHFARRQQRFNSLKARSW